jgi:pimeloyl-ACP methyl ester carboxylesterase
MLKSKVCTGLIAIWISCLFAQPPIQYGSNKEAGNYEQVNDIKMYYEVYGEGDPLLLISGNNGSIANWSGVIPFYAKKYKVIACDSRAQGRSYDSDKEITYSLMASDYNQLLNKLQLDSIYLFGWSDGGIIGLDMAINYPSKIKKMVIAGVNFVHDTTALYPRVIETFSSLKATPFEELPELFRQSYTTLSPQPERARITFNKLMDLILNYPDYSASDLAKINAPTLVIAGDHDLIREEHTLKLFQSIPHSQLLILPGTSHIGLLEKPDLINIIVDDFLSTPYKEMNRYYFIE